ncbi:MAG: hypothetical protein SFX74_05100 [Fimbriimonadaceae bacterium]|nr:hypothetical protein [Fimbriimonadaceae bacterium]
MVEVWLGTGVRVAVNGELVTLATRHERAIVARLALSAGQSVARDTLARELWPASSLASARLSLRQRLHALRTQLGSHIAADRQAVALVASRVILEPVPSPKIFLDELGLPGLPWGQMPDHASHHAAPEPVRPDAVVEWLDAMIEAGDAPTFPYLGRPQDLTRHLARTDPELWRATAMFAAVMEHRFEAALQLWDDAPEPWCTPAYGAFALEWSGNAAHGLGDYHLTIATFLEAGRRYQSLGAVQSGWRMRFKVHRVMVDMGAVTAGERGLNALSARYGRDLTPGLRRMLDFNLVFAHACAGHAACAREAEFRARRAVPELDPSSAFLEANVSTAALERADLPAARAALARYAEQVAADPAPSASDLLWVRAADLFGRAGDFELAAVAHRLLTYEVEASGRRISAINRQRFTHEINGLLARGEGSHWLRAATHARRLSPAEAAARIRDALAR